MILEAEASRTPNYGRGCYAAGASAYHVKPVRHPDHLTVLVDLLTYWLSRVVLPTGEHGHG